MSMDSRAARMIAVSLTQHAGAEATASQVAQANALAWHAIDTALTPIVGARGVAALYQRSLHLVTQTHACLGTLAEVGQTSLDTAPLRSVLAQQAAGDAAIIGAAVLQTFYELLASLIGPSLTERLLRLVWAPFLSGPPAQDI
jgi:hypothetical protein